jgi:tetratricopeptide (TPR) repeat protein
MEPINGSNTIEGDYYFVSGRSGNRSKNPNKYFDDATILKAAHYKELNTDYGLACRYAFYCAQSYKDAGEKYQNDAIEWYNKCLGLNIWIQEKYYSCLSIGEIYSRKNDYINALKYWCKTIEYDPERIEGIVKAMAYLRNDGQHLLVNALYHKFKNYKKNLQNKLFIFQSMYNDHLEYEYEIESESKPKTKGIKLIKSPSVTRKKRNRSPSLSPIRSIEKTVQMNSPHISPQNKVYNSSNHSTNRTTKKHKKSPVREPNYTRENNVFNFIK